MTLSALGILSSAGLAEKAFEFISTASGTGASGIISFTSIPTDYKHLQIRFTAKNTSTATQINLTINGITTSSYRTHFLTNTGSGATPASTVSATLTSIALAESMTTSTTAGLTSIGVIDIPDYLSATKNTTIRALYGADLSNRLASGGFFSTAAITTITLTASANSFSTLSKFSLYGIKG